MATVHLSQDAQICLTVAVSEAARLGNEYVSLEHLLLALSFDDEAADVLRHAGADLEHLKVQLSRYLEEELESLPKERRGEPRLGLGVQRALALAGSQVEGSGRREIQGSDLLVSIFADPETFACRVLEDGGITRLDVVSFLSHGVGRPQREPAEDGDEEGWGGERPESFESFTTDLVALARDGRLDPLVGRRNEVERMLQVLQRRRKNNPVLVGEPGVGKTALVEGLAGRIADGAVPEAFRQAVIYRLDLGAVVAGTRYRGDFENRLRTVLRALDERREAGERPILFIDELHTVVGAGSVGKGSMDAANLLKPALESGGLRLIGATTWDELRQTVQADPALGRRMQRIEVVETTVDETLRILEGLRERYEAHHGVRYTKAALRAAAELSDRYLRDRRLPDKAIDLMDEAGAKISLAGRTRVGAPEIEALLAKIARIPAQSLRQDDRERLATLEDRLRATVYGQDAAIHQLVRSIKVARAGLRHPDKPVGAFLLTGPTGVGKTEMARQLAEALDVRLLRFDMSEYMERHTVSRLVGAPPGYVGFDRGGLLTEAVGKDPHAVLLLDEIEKAHDDVFNLLLQVMDHGTLTDTNGKETDFRHVILLMTSNLGAREMARRIPGYGGEIGGPDEAAGDRAVEQRFSPEFRNRLDARLRFDPLTPEVMERIVGKMLDELRAQLREKGVGLEVEPEALALLAERGYDPSFGARPLGRLLDDWLKAPLTDALLFGALRRGGLALARVAEDGEGLELRFEGDEAAS